MANSPNLNSNGDLKLKVYSAGAALPDTTQVISVNIYRAVNRIPSAQLVIVDGDLPSDTFPVSDSDQFKPGVAIRIDAGYGEDVVTIFEGIVIKHAVRIDSSNFTRLEVECRDLAVAMTVGRKNANFVDMSDSDIISKILASYSSLTGTVGSTGSTYKELVQYNVSDWDFMLARAEMNGLVVIVDAGKVTVEAPDTSGEPVLTVTYGLDLMRFDAELDARTQLNSVDSISWDPSTQAIIEQSAAPVSLNEQGNLDSATLADVIGLSSYRLQSPVSLESGSLKAWADGKQLKSALARIIGSMTFCGNANAKPGALIEIKGVGDRFNGTIYVSAVRHMISGGSWISDAEFGLDSNWFSEQHVLQAPLAAGLTAGVQGLHIGVVMKLDSDPDGQYKIQVSIPVMKAETDGIWARLSSSYGSSGIGAFFIPEIGDEVILGFFDNNPSCPVILGSLYSSKRKPPYEITADNFTKAIVTRSKLTVEFDEDKKIITITTPGKNKVVLSDDGKSILLQDQNNNKVELSESGIVLDSPKDISISAKGKVSIDAVGNLEMTSKADTKSTALNISNTANVSFVAKGNASTELSASGQTTIKGAMVMIN